MPHAWAWGIAEGLDEYGKKHTVLQVNPPQAAIACDLCTLKDYQSSHLMPGTVCLLQKSLTGCNRAASKEVICG